MTLGKETCMMESHGCNHQKVHVPGDGTVKDMFHAVGQCSRGYGVS